MSRPWLADALLLALCGSVVLVALLLTPSPDAVSLFGHEIPIVCGFRRLTGLPCPGCGLTRSFAFAAHLQIAAAFRAHLLGPVLFAFVAGQVPFRLWRLYAVAATGERSRG